MEPLIMLSERSRERVTGIQLVALVALVACAGCASYTGDSSPGDKSSLGDYQINLISDVAVYTYEEPSYSYPEQERVALMRFTVDDSPNGLDEQERADALTIIGAIHRFSFLGAGLYLELDDHDYLADYALVLQVRTPDGSTQPFLYEPTCRSIDGQGCAISSITISRDGTYVGKAIDDQGGTFQIAGSSELLAEAEAIDVQALPAWTAGPFDFQPSVSWLADGATNYSVYVNYGRPLGAEH